MHAYRLTHYEALSVSRSADAEAIRAAWRAHAKQLHPDLSEGGGSESSEAFLRLQDAYDVLRDPERRAAYDATLDREKATARAAPRRRRNGSGRPPQPARRRGRPQPAGRRCGSAGRRVSLAWAATWRPSLWW
jgi:curved DNA-binding protein CbpA